jgi:hypothetical protein
LCFYWILCYQSFFPQFWDCLFQNIQFRYPTKWEKCLKKDRMHTLTCITQTLFFTFNYLELNKLKIFKWKLIHFILPCKELLKQWRIVNNSDTLVMSLILVFIIYMIFYAITLCFIMFICPFVGPLIWTNKIWSYLILSYRRSCFYPGISGFWLQNIWPGIFRQSLLFTILHCFNNSLHGNMKWISFHLKIFNLFNSK